MHMAYVRKQIFVRYGTVPYSLPMWHRDDGERPGRRRRRPQTSRLMRQARSHRQEEAASQISDLEMDTIFGSLHE